MRMSSIESIVWSGVVCRRHFTEHLLSTSMISVISMLHFATPGAAATPRPLQT